MKTFLFSLIALTLTSHVMAEVPEVRARNMTCLELQDTVRNYGVVTVISKPRIFTKRTTVSAEIECGLSQVKTQGIFRTKDVMSCAAGFLCTQRDVIVIHRRHPRPIPHRYPVPRPIPRRPRYEPRPIPHPIPGPRPVPRGPHYDPRPRHDRPHPTPSPRGPHYDPRPRSDHHRPSPGHHSGGSRGGSRCRGRAC